MLTETELLKIQTTAQTTAPQTRQEAFHLQLILLLSELVLLEKERLAKETANA